MTFGTPLDGYLDPGEKLIWSGQPKQGVRLQASDALMIPFSLMWGGFAFFWEATALGVSWTGVKNGQTDHAPVFMALWGIPFCLMGLYIIFGRFFGDAWSRRKTWYGVTDKRVVVLKSLFSTRVTSIDYANLTNLNFVERKDNSGDILFAMPNWMSSLVPAGWPQWGRHTQAPGFYLLPNSRQVYNQIRDAQARARR